MRKRVFGRQCRIDPAVFASIKAPLLILDPLWQEQFRNRKTEKIISLETKIKDLMKKNARLVETEQTLTNKKKECLSQIRKLAGDVHGHNDLEAVRATEIFKTAVNDINTELDALGRKADKLPDEMEEANRELLAETVSVIYFSMRDSLTRLKTLTLEIERLRSETRRLTTEQTACEEEAARTYQLLHKMVGREVVNILDQRFKL
ncbi:MAG: hypothetical protein LBB94_07435 [Clostridiales bacterium]|jgi:outer membrane murein-binding lipoprotein Lpp|nr:hypothetical protein [Clostridiales bacterium]